LCTHGYSYINDGPIKDIWLKSCVWRGQTIADWTIGHLRFWLEELYQLQVECKKLEATDVETPAPVLLNEEYRRVPYERFGPETEAMLTKRGRSILHSPGNRAKAKQ